VHEQGLADGGAGLAELEIGDGALELQRAGAHADGAAGDEDDLSAVGVEGDDLRGDVADLLRVNCAVLAERGRADFDDDAFGIGKVSHGTNHQTLSMRLWVKLRAFWPL
jgi:hypothetical protein